MCFVDVFVRLRDCCGYHRCSKFTHLQNISRCDSVTWQFTWEHFGKPSNQRVRGSRRKDSKTLFQVTLPFANNTPLLPIPRIVLLPRRVCKASRGRNSISRPTKICSKHFNIQHSAIPMIFLAYFPAMARSQRFLGQPRTYSKSTIHEQLSVQTINVMKEPSLGVAGWFLVIGVGGLESCPWPWWLSWS